MTDLFCPYCNNEKDTTGRHLRLVIGCQYQGPGITRNEVIARADAEYQEVSNGAGCYDNDRDMS
jgi:hypothetical protein